MSGVGQCRRIDKALWDLSPACPKCNDGYDDAKVAELVDAPDLGSGG